MKSVQDFTISKRLKDIFSISGRISKPVFHLAPIRLRFKMSEETYEDKIGMILRVMNKAQAIFDAVFKDSKNISIILDFFSPKRIKNNQLPQSFKDLIEECQFQISLKDIQEVQEIKRDEGYFYTYLLKKKPDYNFIKPIIWAIGGKEIGIKPTADVLAFFIDLEREIIFHLYDDRGLDIVANKKETLLDCYHKYSNWILESKRKEIDQIFG